MSLLQAPVHLVYKKGGWRGLQSAVLTVPFGMRFLYESSEKENAILGFLPSNFGSVLSENVETE